MKRFLIFVLEMVLFTIMFFIVRYLDDNVLQVGYITCLFVRYIFHFAKDKVFNFLKLASEKDTERSRCFKVVTKDKTLVSCFGAKIVFICLIQNFVYSFILFYLLHINFMVRDTLFFNNLISSFVYILFIDIVIQPLFMTPFYDRVVEHVNNLEKSKVSISEQVKDRISSIECHLGHIWYNYKINTGDYSDVRHNLEVIQSIVDKESK